VDRPGTNAGPFADFFPGKTYFDIAALDVYRNDFQKLYYDDLLKLAAGKPVTLAEVGPAPTPAILKEQPKWTWWMLWAVGGRGMAVTNGPMRDLVNDPRSLSRDDPEYLKGIAPIRAASGLPPLSPLTRPAP
jgi:mannan endo-1,4-beta-mannosidase